MRVTKKNFRVFVIVFVVLTGAGLGTLTGTVYSENPIWIAVAGIAGLVSSFILAKHFLFRLEKIAAKAHSVKATWLYSTLVAMVCGIICTTIIHGIMAMIVYPEGPFSTEIGNIWPGVIIVGEIMGAAAGLIVGGICSWIYVSVIAGKSNER